VRLRFAICRFKIVRYANAERSGVQNGPHGACKVRRYIQDVFIMSVRAPYPSSVPVKDSRMLRNVVAPLGWRVQVGRIVPG
jgi:hypothetical protein